MKEHLAVTEITKQGLRLEPNKRKLAVQKAATFIFLEG
jgi:hypothetical protein